MHSSVLGASKTSKPSVKNYKKRVQHLFQAHATKVFLENSKIIHNLFVIEP
jgi:hypothetical protein